MSILEDVRQGYADLPVFGQTALKVAVTFLVGLFVIFILKRYVLKLLQAMPRTDKTVDAFLARLVSAGGWILLIVTIVAQLGVDITALLGGLAIGGFILGFALKDTLGNLAAGMMLLFYRPFNVDDTVTISGIDGDVESLGMAMTTLRTADGRIATIPNGAVFGQEIINHTRLHRRRADVVVGIDYDDNIDTAMKAILAAVGRDPRVLKEPAPSVRVQALADSSVNLQVRPWVATKDFWQAKADMHAIVKQALEEAGCSIPFPQRVIHNA